MDKNIFGVYLAKEGVPDNEAHAKLDLPASPWALWDAMDKVRLQDGETLYLEIDKYYRFDALAPHLVNMDIGLNELNDLAGQLARLDTTQGIAYRGLLEMAVQEKVQSNGGIYANYDIMRDRPCDTLELNLCKGDGTEENWSYHLNAAEQEVLARKMEAFCQQQNGMSLRDFARQLQEEPGPSQQIQM